MELISVTQAAEKWGISTRRVQILLVEERIPGAMRVGKTWVIPADADKPQDARIKTGKYQKNKTQKKKDLVISRYTETK